MNYQIYTSVKDAVEAVRDFDAINFKDQSLKHYSLSYSLEHAKDEWEQFSKSGDRFYGGTTENVIKKYEGDHSYEAKIISSISEQLESEDFFKKKFKFHTRQIVGCRVDIPRYLNNDPRYWFSIKKRNTPEKAVRVYAPMGGLSWVTAKEMRVCGALTCSIVEALEAIGINVELWASCRVNDVFSISSNLSKEQENAVRSDSDYSSLCHLIKIKDSSEYCDLGLINYVTGDNGFYRNIIFKNRILEGCRLCASGAGLMYSGCGGSSNFTRDLIPSDEEYDTEKDIVVPRIYDMDEAKKWIESKMMGFVSNIKEEE